LGAGFQSCPDGGRHVGTGPVAGAALTSAAGSVEGSALGSAEGSALGSTEGSALGAALASTLGAALGVALASALGLVATTADEGEGCGAFAPSSRYAPKPAPPSRHTETSATAINAPLRRG